MSYIDQGNESEKEPFKLPELTIPSDMPPSGPAFETPSPSGEPAEPYEAPEAPEPEDEFELEPPDLADNTDGESDGPGDDVGDGAGGG